MEKSNIQLQSWWLDFSFNWLSRTWSLRFNICLIGISYYTVILKSTCNIWFYRRHSLNKLIMQSRSTTKLNRDLWKWHMSLIKACASKWAEQPLDWVIPVFWFHSCNQWSQHPLRASWLHKASDSPMDEKAASILFVLKDDKYLHTSYGEGCTITLLVTVRLAMRNLPTFFDEVKSMTRDAGGRCLSFQIHISHLEKT